MNLKCKLFGHKWGENFDLFAEKNPWRVSIETILYFKEKQRISKKNYQYKKSKEELFIESCERCGELRLVFGKTDTFHIN